MNKIHKGDTVKILSGEDRGKTGVVHTVIPKRELVVVEGVNMIKKHQGRRNQQPNLRNQTGIIEREAPIPFSKVMVVCKNCGKPTRVSFKTSDDGKKARVCKHCGNVM
jgi:large subunit ribosomal protein L24